MNKSLESLHQSMMAFQSTKIFDIPIEILIEILKHLDCKYILRCMLVRPAPTFSLSPRSISNLLIHVTRSLSSIINQSPPLFVPFPAQPLLPYHHQIIPRTPIPNPPNPHKPHRQPKLPPVNIHQTRAPPRQARPLENTRLDISSSRPIPWRLPCIRTRRRRVCKVC